MASFFRSLLHYPFASPESKVQGSGSHPQGSPWSFSTTSEFDNWYEREIVGSNFGYGMQDFKTECGRAVDQVVRILHQRMPLKVGEVIKGGSLGKGTMLKRISDVDCVIMVNDLPYLRDVSNMSVYVERNLANTNQHIAQAIQDYASVVNIKTNKYMVKTTLMVSGVKVDVDLIPTNNNLVAGKSQVYESMLRRSAEEREFYSASLVSMKLQIEFIKTRPVGVKELIRLVKYWNSQVVGSMLAGRWHLPTSYAMELITIIAWERAGSPNAFNRLQGLKAVLSIIASELSTLNHHWTTYYDASMVQRAVSVMEPSTKQRPFILDPANPTNNVCARFQPTWSDVARIAQETLRSNLLSRVRVNHGWK